jgi:hypothetical protein
MRMNGVWVLAALLACGVAIVHGQERQGGGGQGRAGGGRGPQVPPMLMTTAALR